jgi:hypothetical protein
MPLAVQALLPFALLIGGSALVRIRRLRRYGGVVAATVMALAAVVSAALLLRLAPAERVDIPYLKTFPLVDVGIRLDALSLAFAVTLLLTAFVLLLARLDAADDRRQPWSGWLLTTSASLAVILSANLVLVYVFLQVLTLAWSGALDESAPRSRALRLFQQVADVGLLAVAAVATASVGTSALSGLPSDALGPSGFLLVLLPAVARLFALGVQADRPRAPVIFEPAIAQAAPAGYLMLRLLSIAGGRPPGRPLQVAIFVLALLAAAALCALVLRERSRGMAISRLVLAQSALALALSASGGALGAIAGCFAWLGLVALSGLSTIRRAGESVGESVTIFALMVLPPGLLFPALWLGTEGFNQQMPIAVLALWLAAAAVALTGLTQLRRPHNRRIAISAIWGVLLIAIAAIPGPVLAWIVIPAARIVTPIPSGTVSVDPFGFRAGGSFLPSAVVVVAALTLLSAFLRLRLRVPAPRLDGIGIPWNWPRPPPAIVSHQGMRTLPWRRLCWALFLVVVTAAIAVR